MSEVGRRAIDVEGEGCSGMDARSWAVLMGILWAFTLLSTAYNLLVPPYEASDELSHIHYIHFVAAEGREPGKWRSDDGTWHLETWEAIQPPLYYWMVAGALRAMGRSEVMPATAVRNPEAGHSVFSDPEHIDASTYSAREAAWAHWMRLFSTVLGGLTVTVTFLVARLALPRRRATAALAAAFVAFNPRFLHLSATVSNDTLATVWAALGTAIALLVVRRQGSARLAIALGGVLGLGLWTKLSIMPVALGAMVALAWDPSRPMRGLEDLRRRAIHMAWAGGFALLCVGPLIWLRPDRSIGDPLGIRATYEAHRMLESSRSIASLLGDASLFAETYRTFWAEFGAMVARAPEWGMAVYAALGLVGAVGCGVLAWRERGARRVVTIGAIIVLATYAAYVQHNARVWAMQGRLLFPALPAMAFLLAGGWVAFMERVVDGLRRTEGSRRWVVLLIVGLFALNLVWLRTSVVRTWHLRSVSFMATPDSPRVEGLVLCCGGEIAQTAQVEGRLSRVDVAVHWMSEAVPSGEFELIVYPEDQPESRRVVRRAAGDVNLDGVQRFEFPPLPLSGPVRVVLRAGAGLRPGLVVEYVADPDHDPDGVLLEEGRVVDGDLRFRLHFQD